MDYWYRYSKRFNFDCNLKTLIQLCGWYSITVSDPGPRATAYQPTLEPLYRGSEIVLSRDKRPRPEFDNTWRAFTSRVARLWLTISVFDGDLA